MLCNFVSSVFDSPVPNLAGHARSDLEINNFVASFVPECKQIEKPVSDTTEHQEDIYNVTQKDEKIEIRKLIHLHLSYSKIMQKKNIYIKKE